MNNISTELQAELKAIDAQLQKVIFFNEVKGRYTVQILWRNTECILKWNDKGVTEHLEKLKKEIDFYAGVQQRDIQYIPKIFYIAENYFILEKLNGDSARNSLIFENKTRNINIRKTLNGIQHSIEWMYLENEMFDSSAQKLDPIKEFKHYVGKMLNSGPMNTRNSCLTNKILGVLSVLAVKSIAKSDNSCLQKGLMIHGDLHLNNFYTTNDGRVCILDWENAKSGSRYLELAYLYAQVNYLLSDNENEKLYWKGIMLDGMQRLGMSAELFEHYAELFCSIIECNPRYGYKVNKKQITKKQLKLVGIIIKGYFRRES